MRQPEATPYLLSQAVQRRARDDVKPRLSHAAQSSLWFRRLLSLLGWSAEQEPELQGVGGASKLPCC